MINTKDRLIVALDVDTEKESLDLIEKLSPIVNVFKVGIAPFTGYGHSLLRKIEEKNKKVFLDLKFHDIPNTVSNAAYQAADKKVFMMNFHCMGGEKMLKAAVDGAKKRGDTRTILLGVTFLTSMSEEDLSAIGISGSVESKVMEFAASAKRAGLDGVVASAKEIKKIKEQCGKDFLVVTPGIRPAWSEANDQKRIVTPEKAIADGADYIVVGRPIIADKDPLGAAKKVMEEIERAEKNK